MNAQAGHGGGVEYPVRNGPHFVPSTSRFEIDNVLQSIRSVASISEALRVLGAGVLLASMSLFILQGWSDGNDIRRYLMLLAQTGLLCAAGFALSHGLKETKGARLFFGLALVSVPANFVLLSALVYSVVQWDGALTTVPGYATWQIESFAGTGLTLAGAMMILLPVSLFCFAIMARHSARYLSLNFFVLNMLLLIPIRSSLPSGAVALVGTLFALYTVKKVIRRDAALKTAEGKFALATLFIPAGIILFRSMYFYQVDSVLIAMLSLTAFLAARQVSTFPERNPRIALGLESLSMPLALVFALALTDAFAAQLAPAVNSLIFTFSYAVLSWDVVRRTESPRLVKVIGTSVSIAAALSFTMSVIAEPSALSAFFCLGAGALILMSGIALRNWSACVVGVVTVGASVIFGLDAMLTLIITSSWIDLGIFGALAIATGSVLDRHGVAIKLRLTKSFAAKDNPGRELALDG